MTVYAANILLVVLFLFTSGQANWHYGNEDEWPPQCKDGRHQSPISLTPNIAEKAQFAQFTLSKYYDNYPVRSKNNGHSAEIRLDVAEQLTIQGGGLPDVYVLDHLHFHWQSEHTMNNYRFPLELHLVHYASHYPNISQALQFKNGVAVFSVLFDLSPDEDMEFRPLINVIDKLHDKLDTVEQFQLRVSDYLPRDLAGFYRYNGSLTTPGCTEGILWTVFTNTLPISKSQVESFAMLQTDEHKSLTKNYRSLQPLNSRKVLLKESPIRNAARENRFSFTVLLISTLSYCMTKLSF